MIEYNGPEIEKIFHEILKTSQCHLELSELPRVLEIGPCQPDAFPNLRLYELTNGLTQEQSNSRGTLTSSHHSALTR